jgi:O-antigen/teichoic acid export membrane protein
VSGIRDRLITGTKHLLLANIIVSGAAAVQFIAVARILGKENYGVFRILVDMTHIANLLAVAGLQGAMVKYAAEFSKSKEDLQKVVSNCMTLNVISAAIICGLFAFLSSVIAVKGYNEPRLMPLIIISSATMFITVVFGQFRSIIQGFQQIPLFAKLTVLQGIASVGCVVALTLLFGLIGTAIGFLAGAVIVSVASVFFGLRALKAHGVRLNLSLDKTTAKKMLNYGIPSLLAGGLVFPAFWFGNSVLVWYHGFGELGIFGAANSFVAFMLLIPGSIGIATVPLISELNSQDPARASVISVKTARAAAMALLPVTVILIALSCWIIPLLFGTQYLKAVIPLQLMAVVAYIRSVGGVIGNYFSGTGRMWLNLAFNLLWFLLFIPFSYFLGRRGGANGLAWAYIASYALPLLSVIVYLWLGMRISHRSCILPLLVTSVFAGLTLLLLRAIDLEPLKMLIALFICVASIAVTYAIAARQERSLLYYQVRKAFGLGDPSR